ncbi:MAG TPA: hypothetical protein VEB66_07340 [Opitutaceae bacterium]|nr:hypothetical protein [Opitutaceae bacterium]
MRSLAPTLLAFSLLSGSSLPAAGEARTIAGTGRKGFAGDGGPAAAAQINEPNGVIKAADGSIYFCDTGNQRIRRIRNGAIETIAGRGEAGWSGDGGPALAAKLNFPYEVRLDASGNVFWVERNANVVRRLDAHSGIVTTVAGNGTRGFSGDGGPATAAQMSDVHSIAFDAKGDLYIGDVRNNRIRKVAMATGVITTYAGTGRTGLPVDGAGVADAPIHGPRALDIDRAGNLWVALREGNAVLRIDLADGTVHHVAGTGAKGSAGDGGPAKDCTFDGPKGIAVGTDGRVYVVDTENQVIRRIDPHRGTIERFAGSGARGDGPDGDPLACALNRPHGIFVDRDGTVLIGDSENHRIREIGGRAALAGHRNAHEAAR